MTMRRIPQMMLLLVACLAAATLPVAHGQVASNAAQSVSLSQAIPVDPEITVGSLSNGLRYYVRANKKPEKRAELRLVVKAGSILEDDDQRGLAHFAEHMAFNGTRNFPKHEVVSFLESLGMRFGADINAYTSFDETVYTLTVPTDKPETMDRALLILEDWAQAITFDPVEIDKERGVVLEEWRVRRGAGARMQDKVFPIWLKGSRYPDRLPIGTPEVLKTFAPDRLKKFYTDWYRPDLMAVVAVGDFDKTATEGLIKTHFSRLKSPAAPRARPIYDIPDQPGTRYALMSDKEMTTTSVQISTLLPARHAGNGRCLPAGDGRSSLLGHALGAIVRNHPESGRAVHPGVRGTLDFPGADEGKHRPQCARQGGRHRARSRRAPRRGGTGLALRLHRDRARPAEAGDVAELRADRRREGDAGVAEPRQRVHPQLPRERIAADRGLRVRAAPALPARGDARRGQQAAGRVVSGSQSNRHRVRTR